MTRAISSKRTQHRYGKRRREQGTFALIPHAVQDSQNWKACSGTAIKLVCDIARQFNGRNNGDLLASISYLGRHGWRSSGTLDRAIREARHYGLIELTRQGGLNRASLFAITWKPIDHCGGKLDVSPTSSASALWKEERPKFVNRPKKKPVRMSDRYAAEIETVT